MLTRGIIISLLLLILPAHLLCGQSPDSLWKRSLLRFDNEDYHGVISDLNTLIRLNPDFDEALYNRGIARLYLGDEEGACGDFSLAGRAGSREGRVMLNSLCRKDTIREMIIRSSYGNNRVDPAKGYRPVYTRADTLRGALRPQRTCFDVYYYDLAVKIMPRRRRIEGTNVIYFHVTENCREIQVDLFDNLRISKIIWNGMELAYRREFNAVFIEFPQTLRAGEDHRLSISYGGKPLPAPNPPWDGGFVWETDSQGKPWVSVACEHLGASCWWPNKDHMTEKPDSMLISIDAPEGYQVVSNGNLRGVSSLPRHYNRFSWFVSYPINNYNVTFYMGRYTSFDDIFVEPDGDTLMLNYNVLPENLEKAQRHFAQVSAVLGFYGKAFGDYPFTRDGFGLVESSYAGMEHQSAIAYGNGYDRQRSSYRNRIFDYIIVHEAAHEWWGNSVTACDMADIWIHEGFATFAEYLFLEDRLGKDEYLFELNENSRYIFNIWPMVQNRDVNEDTFAGNDVYNKGAMMLHCLRCEVNDDSLFFRMIKDFSLAYRNKTVCSQDFIGFVSKATGRNFDAFFSQFLYDTDIPLLLYSYRNEGWGITIRYRWSGVDDGFSMPFGIRNDRGESFRLEATTEWKEYRLEGAEWFNFYNQWNGYEGCADNSFTYYRTRCENL